MGLSRRALLAGAGAAALLLAGWTHGVSAHNGGQAQINLWAPSPYNDPWALNLCKSTLHTWQANGASDNNWPSLLNDNGYPTSMPSGGGATWRSAQMWMPGILGATFVLDWTGTATLALTNAGTGGSITESIINSNRREYTIATGPPVTNAADGSALPCFLVLVTISALTGALSNVRLYNKSYESLINGSGAIAMFDPNFLSRVRQFGVLRFMDWHQCNSTRLYQWADRHVEADFNWAGDFLRGSYWYGTATQSLNKQTLPSLPSLSNGKIVQFWMPARPVNKVITATVVGNPTQFTIAGHGLSDGNKVGGDQDATGGGSWNSTMNLKSAVTGLPPEYTVTVIDTDTVTINLNSTGFAAPSGTFRLIPQIQISDGVTTKRCLRKGLINYFNSEFSTYASGAQMTAIYDATFDVFVLSGDGSGNVLDLGLPFTAMIALANYCRAHPWFTIDYMATDDFWTQLATLCKSSLQTGLVPRFESGNEIWNTGTSFWQTGYAASCAAAVYANGAVSTDIGYAGRVAQVSDLIKAVYGSGSTWQMIMGVQGAAGSLTTARGQGNSTINGGSSAGYPANKCDAIAFAPYIVTPFTFSGSAASYAGFVDAVDSYVQGDTTTAFAYMLAQMTTPTNGAFGNTNQWLDGWISTFTPTWISAWATYAGRTSKLVCHYEGGNGIPGSDRIIGGFPAVATSSRTVTVANVRAFFIDWLLSSQAATLMTNYLTRSKSAGVVFPSQYALTGSWSNGAVWGSYRMNDYAALATLQYTALLNWNATG